MNAWNVAYCEKQTSGGAWIRSGMQRNRQSRTLVHTETVTEHPWRASPVRGVSGRECCSPTRLMSRLIMKSSTGHRCA